MSIHEGEGFEPHGYKSSPELRPWERALTFFQREGKTYGDTIQKIELYEWLGLPYPRKQMIYADAARLELEALPHKQRFFHEVLKKHKMLIAPVGGGGIYRILFPHEQIEYAVVKADHEVQEAIRKRQDRLQYTNTSTLDMTQRKEHAEALAKTSRLSQFMRQARQKPKFKS